MSDPKRLLDDPSAPVELRDALRRTAAADPVPYDEDKGLARLQAALVTGAAASTAGSAAAASSGMKTWLALTLGAVGALGLAGAVVWGTAEPAATEQLADGRAPRADVAGGAEVAERTPEAPEAPEPQAAAPVLEQSAPTPEEAVATDTRETAAPTAEPPAVEPAPTRQRVERSARRPRSAAAAEAEATAAPLEAIEAEPEPAVDDRLREETIHLAQVRRALEGSPAEALRLAREGQRQFAGGVFAEEREALVVFALDRLGRDAEARERAGRFVARHPNGPLTGRVRAILENP